MCLFTMLISGSPHRKFCLGSIVDITPTHITTDITPASGRLVFPSSPVCAPQNLVGLLMEQGVRLWLLAVPGGWWLLSQLCSFSSAHPIPSTGFGVPYLNPWAGHFVSFHLTKSLHCWVFLQNTELSPSARCNWAYLKVGPGWRFLAYGR